MEYGNHKENAKQESVYDLYPNLKPSVESVLRVNGIAFEEDPAKILGAIESYIPGAIELTNMTAGRTINESPNILSVANQAVTDFLNERTR